MLFRASIRQARRAPVRMILCFVLMALVCAFLTLGLNLRASTEHNLKAIYDSYEVIAVPNFQAYVRRSGLLTQAGDHAGYWPCAARDFDLTPLLEAEGVKSIDVRSRYGAYVSNEGFERGVAVSKPHTEFSDVIRFVYTGAEPVTLELVDRYYEEEDGTLISLKVLWSGAGYPVEDTYPAELPVGKSCGAAVTLQPGQEYVAAVTGSSFSYSDRIGDVRAMKLSLDVAWPFYEVEARYDDGAHWQLGTYADFRDSFEPLHPYTEDFWDTQQGQLFARAAECSYYDIRSVNAVTTNDLYAALPFYKGNMTIAEGRAFTQAEYDNGAPVCLVSTELAKLNGWQVGDSIELSFFENEYMYTRIHEELFPRYWSGTGDFFHTGTYEIIGMYDGLVTVRDGMEIDYNDEIGTLWIDVYLPEKSVENAPAPILHNYNTTIRLETLSGMKFLADMEDSGLTKKQETGYQVTFTLYDQGISAMAEGLSQMAGVSDLTVALSVAASLLSVAVLVIFHLSRSRREIACLRSLGLRRHQVLVVVLAGLLMVSLVGCLTGAVLGHVTSKMAAEAILAAASEDLGDTTFTVNMSQDILWTKLKDYQFQSAQLVWAAALSACAVMGAMTLFSMVLVWLESRKPPLLQLGRRE